MNGRDIEASQLERIRGVADRVAASRGADAVLLIAGVLGNRLPAFVDAVYGAGLEPLVEVRNAQEIGCTLSTRAQLVGINNRDLSTMTIDRSTTRKLSEQVRARTGWLFPRAGCGQRMISGNSGHTATHF